MQIGVVIQVELTMKLQLKYDLLSSVSVHLSIGWLRVADSCQMWSCSTHITGIRKRRKRDKSCLWMFGEYSAWDKMKISKKLLDAYSCFGLCWCFFNVHQIQSEWGYCQLLSIISERDSLKLCIEILRNPAQLQASWARSKTCLWLSCWNQRNRLKWTNMERNADDSKW